MCTVYLSWNKTPRVILSHDVCLYHATRYVRISLQTITHRHLLEKDIRIGEISPYLEHLLENLQKAGEESEISPREELKLQDRKLETIEAEISL